MPSASLPALARVSAVVAAVALGAPSAANAHIRSGILAVDYRASVLRLPAPVLGAVAVRVFESDRALGLTVRSGHGVVVLGYFGEPFLRLDAAGVAVNKASLTAAGVGFLKRPALRVDTAPVWQLRSNRPTVVWHDARLRGLPPGVQRWRWTVPFVVDGRRVRFAGKLWRVDAPSPWPWVALGMPFLVLTTLLLFVRRLPLLRTAAVGLGAVATGAAIAAAAGFMLDPNASAGRWIEGANELVFALVGLAVVARGSPDARAIAGGALGLLGLSIGLSKIPVLLHGVVLSALPGTLARLAVVLAICAGAAATAVGLVVFFVLLEPKEPLVSQRQFERPS